MHHWRISCILSQCKLSLGEYETFLFTGIRVQAKWTLDRQRQKQMIQEGVLIQEQAVICCNSGPSSYMFTLSKRIESIWHFGTPFFFAEIRSNLSVKMQQKANCYKWDPSKIDFHFQAPWSCWQNVKVEYERRPEVPPLFSERSIQSYEYNGCGCESWTWSFEDPFSNSITWHWNWVAFVTCYTPCYTFFFKLKSCLSLKTIL